MHLLASDQYRTSYVTMRELVDHYFPPVGLLVKEGGEEYTDFNYWRDRPLEIDEFSASESGDGSEYQESQYQADGRPSIEASVRSEAGQTEAENEAEDLEASFYSRASLDSRPGFEEAFDPSLESSILEELEDDDEMMSFPPETPYSERHFQLEDEYHDPADGRKVEAGEGVEFEVEDESGNLAGLDLASEATPHVGPMDGDGLRPVEELGRVLSSPERRRREVD
jgi:phosphatidate phosphatase LPIN